MKLVFPVVNRNGDTRDVLLAELSDARDKLEVAVRALMECQYANGRNYQLNPAGEAGKAYRDHCDRVTALQRITHELLEIQYEIGVVQVSK
jgi:hypothetical protein